MKTELKQRWVKALRSGKYKQGRGQLRLNDGIGDEKIFLHCCIGVLCELIDEDAWECHYTSRTDYWKGDSSRIGDEHLDEIGLRVDDQSHLMLMNDGDDVCTAGCSFKEIADWIEENVNESE